MIRAAIFALGILTGLMLARRAASCACRKPKAMRDRIPGVRVDYEVHFREQAQGIQKLIESARPRGGRAR